MKRRERPQPWRGEYIANFGHPPEDVRLPTDLKTKGVNMLAVATGGFVGLLVLVLVILLIVFLVRRV